MAGNNDTPQDAGEAVIDRLLNDAPPPPTESPVAREAREARREASDEAASVIDRLVSPEPEAPTPGPSPRPKDAVDDSVIGSLLDTPDQDEETKR